MADIIYDDFDEEEFHKMDFIYNGEQEIKPNYERVQLDMIYKF